MGETDGGAAEACLLSQWPVWAVVAFPRFNQLMRLFEYWTNSDRPAGQLARGVVVRRFFTSQRETLPLAWLPRKHPTLGHHFSAVHGDSVELN